MAKKVGSIYAEIRARLDKYERDLQRAHTQTITAAAKIQKSVDTINFDKAASAVKKFGIGLGAYLSVQSLKNITAEILQVNASFEQLSAKLNVVTGGQGQQTFDYLYRLVRELPVGIESITQGFVTMTAMGLKPTEKQLKTLTDVAAVLGDDVFGRIVLQLGQMTTKGKVMAEDLTILAEAGINARKYIKDAFNMTIEQIQESGIAIEKVTEAIFKGMAEQFSGASKQMADTWQGRIVQLIKAWQELSINIGKLGAFQFAKDSVDGLTSSLNKLNNQLVIINESAPKAARQDFTRRIEQSEKFKQLPLVELFGLSERWTGDPEKLRNEYWERFVKPQLNLKPGFEETRRGPSFQTPQWTPSSAFKQKEGNWPEYTKEELADLKKKHEDYLKSVADAAEKAKKEHEQLRQEISNLQQEFEDTKTFSGEGSNFERMEQQLRSGSELSQMYSEAAKNANEEFAKLAERENELLMQQVSEYEKTFKQLDDLSERTAEAMQNNFSDLFFDAITGELKTLEDYADAVFKSIARMVSDLAAQQLTRGLFGPTMQGGGWLSGLAGLLGFGGAASLPINQPGYPGAEILHSGGISGKASSHRNVPASAFSFAPRLHSGLMPDEYPAVLQKGEAVIPKGRSMNNNVTINIAAPNGVVSRESISQMSAALYASLQRSGRRNT